MDQPLIGTYTPETLARRRKLADIYAQGAVGRPAQNLGEGLAAIGNALAARGLNKKADEAEARGQESANTVLSAMMNGERVEGPGGVDARLLSAAQNPWLSDGQRSVVSALINRDFGVQDQAAEAQQWEHRFNLQNQAQNDLLGRRQAFDAEQAALERASRESVAGARAEAAGKFYAVPTGSGTMLVDKGTGMATMLGVDESGSPVQIGQTFRPSMSVGGQPLPIPADGVAQQPQGDVRPLMPPSIDAAAQRAVAGAKVEGKDEGERPQRLRAAQSAMAELEAQQTLVQQDIDRAIEMVQRGGVGPLGVTGVGSMLGVIPGTDAYDTGELLGTIKANLGFDKLQAMRDASPTGGALGQVTERELAFLQSTAGSINQGQSQEQILANLHRLKAFLAGRGAERKEAFDRDFGAATPQPTQTDGWSIQRIE